MDEPVRIGEWEVLPDRNLIRRGAEMHSLEPRLVAVLLALAAEPGRVVPRDELLTAVWGETIVQEEALTQAVSQLRRLLGDEPRNPRYIETVPKKGYRLLAAVAAGPTAERRERPRRAGAVAAGVVLLVAIALVIGSVARKGQPVPWRAVPLTTLEGEEVTPARSPDGRFTAFARLPADSNRYRLHIAPVAGGPARRLTGGPGHDLSPAWSPDGERLAFVRHHGGRARVAQVAAMGGPVRLRDESYHAVAGLDWSPDGASLVLAAKIEKEAPVLLWRVPADGGAAEPFTEPDALARGDSYPRFSPDGRRLAFVRGDRGGSRRLHVMPAGGGEPRGLGPRFFNCGGMDWSADGRSLIVSASLRGPLELWRVSLDGGEVRHLPAKGHRVLGPATAAGVPGLVYVESALDTDLVIGRTGAPDEAAAERTVASSTRAESAPRFSPDGAQLALISERGGTSELWLHDLAAGTQRRLTDFASDALQRPRWSPDGSRIAVNVARDGILQVVVIDVASGLQRQVTRGEGHHRLAHWSRDGAWLYYSRENGEAWQISRVQPDGAGAEDVPLPGCFSLGEAVDGGLLYFMEFETGVYRRSAGGTRELIDLPHVDAETPHLEFDGEGFRYLRLVDGGAELVHQPLAGGEPRIEATIAGRPTGEFHVSPATGAVVCTVLGRSGSDLVIAPDQP